MSGKSSSPGARISSRSILAGLVPAGLVPLVGLLADLVPAVALLAGLAAPGGAAASGPQSIRPIASTCRAVMVGTACQCSIETVEAELTFPDAAGVIEFLYRQTGDPRYVELMAALLRQCRVATYAAGSSALGALPETPPATLLASRPR